MKKIFSYFLITILSINIFWVQNINASNEKMNYTKGIIITKWELNKTNIWRNYVKQIDNLYEKIKNNEAQLKNLNSNLENLLKSNNIKNKEVLNTLMYLQFMVKVWLFDLEDNKLNQIISSNISDNDKKIAEKEIIKLQHKMVDSWENFMENILKEIKSTNNFNEKWDVDFKLDINLDSIAKIEWWISLKKYEAINYWLDSKIKWDFKINFNWDIEWELIEFNTSSNIDFISKDGDMYLKFDNLEISSNQDLSFLNEYTNKIIELSKNNKYIKIEDNSSKLAIELINNFNYNKYLLEARGYANNPMFEAYSKEWNKYYLKPTKDFCDTFKEIANKFDPFYWKTCSNSQYNEMLKEFNELMNIYISINWNETTLWYEWKDPNFKENNWYITFNDKEITKVIFNLSDKKWEFLTKFSYENNKFELSSKVSSSYDNFILNLNWELDNNKIINNLSLNSDYKRKKWKFDYNTWEYIYENNYSKIFESNIVIRNKNISWETKFFSEDKEIIKINTTGNYSLNKMDIKNKISYGEEIKNMINYSNQIEKARDSSRISDLRALTMWIEQFYQDNWEYPRNRDDFINWIEYIYIYELPTDPSWNIEINWCKFWYYYEVWKDKNGIENQTYKLSTCFESEDNINNRAKIDWWSYDNKYEIWFVENKFNKWFYISDIKSWDKIEKKQNENNDLYWNLDISYDMTNNKNNFLFIFNIINWNTKIINLEMESNANRTINNDKINTPSDYINAEDIFDLNNLYYYMY